MRFWMCGGIDQERWMDKNTNDVIDPNTNFRNGTKIKITQNL